MLTLKAALDDLADAVSDLHRAGSAAAEPGLSRIVSICDEEPLSGHLRSLVPSFDLDAWWTARIESATRSGSAKLEWPRKLPERVACRLELCRRMATRDWRFDYLTFARLFGMTDGNTDDRLARVVGVVVEPLISEIRRLSELRPPSPLLGSLLARGFPPSGDQRLDELLEEASAKFLDAAPVTRKEGLERLWDSWERLKTLANPADKKKSIGQLLDEAAAPPSALRQVLEIEATTLSGIGNNFEIRHFELSKSPMSESAHIDYLFHRLAALIRLVLESRARS